MILTPKEIRRNYAVEVGRWLPKCHANREVCQTLWKLDADYAREIYKCCLSEPEYLEHYLGNEKALSRLLPAVLGAFSGKCALLRVGCKPPERNSKGVKVGRGLDVSHAGT